MPAASPTKAPRIDVIRFGPLAEGDSAELTKRADLDSVRYSDLTVTHLDLTDAHIAASQFVRVTSDETDLRGTHLSEVELDQVALPVVRAARSQWHDVRISGRLGMIEAYDSRWRSVTFAGCKLSFVNLRGAELTDIAFTNCRIEELDLANARLSRVRLTDTHVASLKVQHSELRDFDLRAAGFDSIDGLMSLRGTTISPDQLSLLAPLLAEEMGLKVETVG